MSKSTGGSLEFRQPPSARGRGLSWPALMGRGWRRASSHDGSVGHSCSSPPPSPSTNSRRGLSPGRSACNSSGVLWKFGEEDKLR